MLRPGSGLDDADDGNDDDDAAKRKDGCHGDFLLLVDLSGLETVELA